MALPVISELASKLGPMILPYLPYLLKGITKAADVATAIGRKLGEVEWDTVFKIWEKIRPQAEKQPEVKKRLEEVAAKKDDPRAEAMLSWDLEKLLAALQPKEITEIQNLLSQSRTETRQVIAKGERSIAVGGDVSGSTFTTGDRK